MVKSLYRFLSKRHQTIHLDYHVDFKPRWGAEGLKPLKTILDKEKSEYESFINSMLEFKEDFHGIKKCNEEKDATLPCWNNEFLPGLDITSLFTVVAKYKPNKYVEVGSGNSTKVAFLAKNKYSPETEIISIDPYPRVEVDSLSNSIIRKPFEQCDLSVFEELEEGDVVFIDNSHRMLPNSDVTVFFLEVLPKLKKGVIVQVHDIYLPYDYPDFMCERAYSEQYALAIYLLNSQSFTPLFPAYYISQEKELANSFESIWNHPNLNGVERHGGSFWFRIQ